MRAYIGHLLSTDPTLNNLGINRASLYAGDADTPKERPYMVLRWGDTTVGLRKTVMNARNLTIWVHDKGNDYTRIDQIIMRCRALLESVYGQRTEIGWINEIEWVTDSSDLADDGTITIARTSMYAIVASGI